MEIKYNEIPLGVIGKPKLTSKLKKKALAQTLKAYIKKGEPQVDFSPINLPGELIPKVPIEEATPPLTNFTLTTSNLLED